MKLLKKLLLLLLSLSVFGYGSAWAFDGHVIDVDTDAPSVPYQSMGDLVDHQSGIQAANTSDDDRPVDGTGHSNHQSCDHCCHISAHLQAIFSQHNGMHYGDNARLRHDFSEHALSFTISPDLRPPRV